VAFFVQLNEKFGLKLKVEKLTSILAIIGGQVEYGAKEFIQYMVSLPEAITEWSPTNFYQR